ncbi:hypothetical protein GCM10023149_25490 [Mucilaginibacter gynuensis]|uniref:Pentapeptide MXKDX repeat protein n=1 Tax=Mucilaginibacter gynuensis TaxID=1302236 RepID=A0ABP8GH19_9SPHI
MKKTLCMLALGAFSFGSIYAAGVPTTTMQQDTTKKVKKDKKKMKKHHMKDSTDMKMKDTTSKM